jgi:F0F1-type ATP synthase assembly protein I
VPGPNESRQQREREKGRYDLVRYAGIGVELAAAVTGLTLAGFWVDYHFKTRPVGVLVGAGIGIVGGMFNFIRDALRISRLARTPAEEQTRKEPGDDEQR